MKIGIDARLWNQTGVGRYIRNLVFNLEKIDKVNDYVLFVRKKDKVSVKSPNFKIVEVDIPWHSLSEQLKFPGILNEENLDMVHFPYISAPLFYNKPFILTIHDLILHHYPTGRASTLPLPFYGVKLLAYRFLVRKLAFNSRRIIVPSLQTKEEIVDHFKINPNKISVTYEAADRKLIKKNLGKKQFFLYVGNAYPHKNLEKLVRVFNKLKSARLILVGKDDYFYERLKREAGQNIKFIHNITDSELSRLYGEAKYFIAPSFMEGFGLSVLEAMANGCVALLSDIPAFREVSKNSAIYFDPKKESEIYEKVLTAINNNYDENKIVESELKVSREFSWEKMAKETLNIYKQSLRTSP
ncbi:MAG TPA: glycosyltransferase family 1 protein [Patescibacteria group bacterium]|nr:glycosyltransferase family 1 protein [Patescibacteria group bacterium]